MEVGYDNPRLFMEPSSPFSPTPHPPEPFVPLPRSHQREETVAEEPSSLRWGNRLFVAGQWLLFAPFLVSSILFPIMLMGSGCDSTQCPVVRLLGELLEKVLGVSFFAFPSGFILLGLGMVLRAAQHRTISLPITHLIVYRIPLPSWVLSIPGFLFFLGGIVLQGWFLWEFLALSFIESGPTLSRSSDGSLLETLGGGIVLTGAFLSPITPFLLL